MTRASIDVSVGSRVSGVIGSTLLGWRPEFLVCADTGWTSKGWQSLREGTRV
jgi:hypothetical protein